MDAIRRLADFLGVSVAVFYSEVSLDSLPEDTETRGILTLLNTAEIAIADRDLDRGAKILDEASRRLSPFQASALHGRLKRLMGSLHRLRGEFDEATRNLLDALTVDRTTTQRGETIRSLLELAAIHADQQRHQETQHYYELALSELGFLDDTDTANQRAMSLQCLLGLGIVARRSGRFDEALAKLTEAVRLAEGLVDSRRVARAYLDLSALARDLENPAGALQTSIQVLRIYRAREDQKLTADAHQQLAVTLLWMGRYDEAKDWLEKSKAAHQTLGDDLGTAHDCLAFAQLSWKLGDLSQARAWANRAYDLAVTLQAPQQVGEVTLVLALIADSAGNREEAHQKLEEAIRVFETHRLTADLATALRHYAECAERWGAPEEANRLYRQSLQLLQHNRGGGGEMLVDMDPLAPEPADQRA